MDLEGRLGSAVVIIAAIGGLLGYQVSAADQAQLVESGALIVSGVGGLLALWGRIAATRRIGWPGAMAGAEPLPDRAV